MDLKNIDWLEFLLLIAAIVACTALTFGGIVAIVWSAITAARWIGVAI